MARSFSKNMIICILACLAGACSDEFNPNLPSVPTPVLYGVINPADGQYSVRLTRTFIGTGDAYDMARKADSLYYHGAQVFLETRDLSGNLLERTELKETVIGDRAAGVFAETPNIVYQTDASHLHLTPGYFSSRGLPYKINLSVRAVVPGQGDTIQSTTRLRSVPRITKPQYYITKVYLYSEEPFSMAWMDSNGESYFEILIRMRYTDFLYDDERDRVAEWVLTGVATNETSFSGGEQAAYSYYFRPENFYSHLRSVIPEDPEVEARVARDIDFMILSTNEDLEFYRRAYEISDDYRGSGYSNITNGLGLFTTYSAAGIYGLQFGRVELDSLAGGKYTKHLKFKNW